MQQEVAQHQLELGAWFSIIIFDCYFRLLFSIVIFDCYFRFLFSIIFDYVRIIHALLCDYARERARPWDGPADAASRQRVSE